VLLLIEVLERHTGLVSARLLPELKRGRESIREVRPSMLRWRRKKKPIEFAEPAPSQPGADRQTQPEAPEAKQAKPEIAPAAILDALRQARQQAKERTKR